MVAPTQWSEATESANSWFQETPEFALYDSNQFYNADIPYDLGVKVNPAEWNSLNAIATQWSEA